MRNISAQQGRRARSVASVTVLLVAAACIDSGNRTTGPSSNAGVGARKASGDVILGIPPMLPCVDSIFKANFTADALNAFPGAPVIGSWVGNQSAGTIRVRSAIGLLAKPVELTQRAGLTGGVDLKGTVHCMSAPSTGTVYVDWRSLVRSSTVVFAAVALRDNQSRVLGSVEYRPNGAVTYNGIPVPGVAWVANVHRQFRIRVDLAARTTSLYVDNVLKLANVPYFQATASNFWRISMELGGTSAQSFAWDDILVVRYN